MADQKALDARALRAVLDQLLQRRSLSEAQGAQVLRALTDPGLAPAVAAGILIALRAKGVVADELRGFARAMRELARRPLLPPDLRAIDIVGTGGDSSGSLNLSTGTALLVASCGLPVIKHGNRSISSRSGSADVLEQLGLHVPLDEAAAAQCLAATGFTFLFAPHYHPAMKALAPIRAALGVRTIFNIMGPLTNPAAPPLALIGAYDLPTATLIAEALAASAVERVFVVHAENGWDEPTPICPFTLLDVRAGRVSTSERSAADYGLASCDAVSLAGADAAYNAAALRAVLSGTERGAHRDALLLGASLALEIAGVATDPRAGVALAAAAIDDGRAATTLARLAEFGHQHKAVS